jgi:predicted RNA-binding Zn ribbon-like protein
VVRNYLLLYTGVDTLVKYDCRCFADVVPGYILAFVSPHPNNTFFDAEPGGRVAAPGPLALVQAFVNTAAEEGQYRWEAFADPDSLRYWLVRKGLLDEEAIGDADVAWAKEVRRGLRSLLAANNGGEIDPGALETLNNAAARAGLVVQFGPDGRAALETGAGGVEGAIGRVLEAVCAGMEEGGWERLKTCANGHCGWAFYDRSKNRSGRWCSMDVCGNRAKTRAYRRRTSARGT